MFGRNILILRPCASDFRGCCRRVREFPDGRSVPVLDPPGARRPPRRPDRPRPHRGGAAELVRGARLRRGRDLRAAGLARQRDASPCLFDRPRLARRNLRPALLPHIAEFACKKLLSAGEQRIVEFARVFRNRERGALHAPEFTMLEWYRAQAPYEALMEDCTAIIALAAEAAGTQRLTFRGGRSILLSRPNSSPSPRHSPATPAST